MFFFKKSYFSILFFLPFIQGVNAQKTYTLQEALQTAKTHNAVLRTEKFNIAAAEADIISVRVRPNPNLHNESLQLIRSSEYAENTQWYNGKNREMFWELSKPFQLAGQRKHQIDLAQNNVLLAERSFADLQRDLYLAVAEKWLNVWVEHKQLELIRQALGNIDSLLTTNQMRYRNEVITRTELHRTELLAKQYRLHYATAMQGISGLEKELGLLMGIRGRVEVDTADQLSFAIPDQLDSLTELALDQRSDVLAVRSLIDASESNISLQRSLAYPVPEFGAIYNPQGTVPFLGVTFSVDLPFFDRNQGGIKHSTYAKDQASQQLEAVQAQVATEVSVAFSNYQFHQRNLEEFNSLLESARTILDNVEHAYLGQGTTMIDLLEAQRSWLETQEQYYNALRAYRQSHAQLLHATGLIHQLAP